MKLKIKIEVSLLHHFYYSIINECLHLIIERKTSNKSLIIKGINHEKTLNDDKQPRFFILYELRLFIFHHNKTSRL